MEDHHQYGMADLRQYMNGGGRPIFGSIQAAAAVLPSELIPATAHQQQQQLNRTNLGPGHHHQYEMVMGSMTQVPSSSSSAHGLTTHHHHHQHQHRHQHEFLTDSSPVGAATTSAGFSGMDQMETGGGGGCVGGGGDGSGRWPRQETLTLLEIRSRLDSKFKEANQKGPLWDEISRIMCEEHGYQRTGKKCREKFENLYKYYKKTKEGKAGRQDGKHYRFFRQLEALYGETSNNISASGSEALHLGSHFPYNPVNSNNFQHQQQQAPTLSDSPSLISSSEFNTTSSDQDSDQEYKIMGKKRRGKRSLKAKIKDFIDEQMRKLMEKQEAWLEKMMKMIEHKEQERISREEEWRNQETIRMEREHKFWANERAWIEARDASLMEAVHKLSGKDLMINSTSINSNPRYHDPDVEDIVDIRGMKDGVDQHWSESEITRLIQLRTSMESRFQQLGDDDNDDDDHVLWEEIGAKMTILGYEKSGTMCKNKWSNIINSYLIKCNKKRKDQNTTTSLSSCYNNNSNHHVQINNQYYEADGSSCFRYLMGDHAHQQQNLWENYELKLTKGGGDGDGGGGGGGNN